MKRTPQGDLPDVRDGLTRLERVILYVLHETQHERNGNNVPTAMLYGRVVEKIDVGIEEFQAALVRLSRPAVTRVPAATATVIDRAKRHP